MSRKHPQNGPSLSKAPPKKQKLLNDKEVAERQARQKSAEEALTSRIDEAQRKVASGWRFGAAVEANGGVIPMRGGNAEEFWSKIARSGQGSFCCRQKSRNRKLLNSREGIRRAGGRRLGRHRLLPPIPSAATIPFGWFRGPTAAVARPAGRALRYLSFA